MYIKEVTCKKDDLKLQYSDTLSGKRLCLKSKIYIFRIITIGLSTIMKFSVKYTQIMKTQKYVHCYNIFISVNKTMTKSSHIKYSGILEVGSLGMLSFIPW